MILLIRKKVYIIISELFFIIWNMALTITITFYLFY